MSATVEVSAIEQIAPRGRVWRTGLLAAAIATAANIIIFLVASALGASFDIMPPTAPAPPFIIALIGATVVGVLACTLVFSLMPRFSRRPVRTFRIVAIVVLVLSLLQPLALLAGALPGSQPVGWNTVLTLTLMHIVTGVIAIRLLTTRAAA